MRYLRLIILFIIFSCNNHQQQPGEKEKADSVKPSTIAAPIPNSHSEICWMGTINGKTPVFLHYQLDSNLVIGQIQYLNTKDKVPIIILGTIENDKSYRLLEFEKTGNITGVITGKTIEDSFKGDWVSPKTKKELALTLFRKDTSILSIPVSAEIEKIFGTYRYQYGEKGYEGEFELTKLPNSKASFGITSVTGEPARNVAQIDDDTILLKTTRFTYELPNTTDCGFEAKFYNDFLYIRYTKGFCAGQFGNNATIEGIFLKTR